MQIIIPMSGFGERFRRAGYQVPKPLIEIDGKPTIAHVVDMFPGESDITFICNREHLETPAFRMRELLEQYCSSGRICAIEPHRKGPVHAVAQTYDEIDPDAPTIVNYCDFTCFWDYHRFTKFVRDCDCDGAIPAYRGFHPHSLGSTYYAYVKEHNGWALDIQEKQPFTDTPMQEFASSGTYYFRSGALMRECFERTMAAGLMVNDEYYVSMAYKPLMQDRRPVAVYELQHFMQWGTPQDLADYRYWSSAFARMVDGNRGPAHQDGTVLMPMAGLGSRFRQEGYEVPKPLIDVSGRAMVVQATNDLPAAPGYVFVMRDDMLGVDETEAVVTGAFTGAGVVRLAAVTSGQAETCLLGLEGVDLDAPLTIGACDNGTLYDSTACEALMADPTADVIVWGMRGYPGARHNPAMYGWIDADNGQVTKVSVKVPLADPDSDPVVIGAFTFRRARDFVAAAERMMSRDARVNGEFYVDTCINDAIALGFDCRLFEVDAYLCWGTPDDLRTFEYWQSCFHKWPGHPYRLDDDPDVPAEAAMALAKRYAPLEPRLPGRRP